MSTIFRIHGHHRCNTLFALPWLALKLYRKATGEENNQWMIWRKKWRAGFQYSWRKMKAPKRHTLSWKKRCLTETATSLWTAPSASGVRKKMAGRAEFWKAWVWSCCSHCRDPFSQDSPSDSVSVGSHTKHRLRCAAYWRLQSCQPYFEFTAIIRATRSLPYAHTLLQKWQHGPLGVVTTVASLRVQRSSGDNWTRSWIHLGWPCRYLAMWAYQLQEIPAHQ